METQITLKNGITVDKQAIAQMAGIAAFEVENVYSLHGKVTRDIIEKLGIKIIKRSVEVNILDDGNFEINLNVKIKYGVDINATAKNIQEAVNNSIEQSLGMKPVAININVVDVEF
ncbi:MAG TPA: Asp23/Gls24 family envelope stress response protein [Tenericutes bacterium]|jgi:uncharacterized alkaline shock family protein YloU|nr:Asp23/Gls24 family envelope stress response protein [Mycoplasmatota bacterium]